MPHNRAAWLPGKYARLQVEPAPYTPPGPGEIVIRNRAVAINPVDWITQTVGFLVTPWAEYPCILGTDVAGEVVELGEGVSRFRVGDRVVGHALGMSKTFRGPAKGAFQSYTVLVDFMTAPIPESVSYESAAVLPLGVSTAACGLFQKDYLALQLPSAAPAPTGKTLLIWGGSTSVGANAIQLAVAAGYDVITTCSPRNFEFVRRLGASQVFDYNGKTVVADIVTAFRGKTIAGALSIGVGSAEPCADILGACEGDRFLATASAAISFNGLKKGGPNPQFLGLMSKMAAATAAFAIKTRSKGVRTKFIFGSTLADNETGPAIWVDYLPKALASGAYRPAPDPWVVGHGLEQVQAGFDAQKKGVSAKKVVIALD